VEQSEIANGGGNNAAEIIVVELKGFEEREGSEAGRHDTGEVVVREVDPKEPSGIGQSGRDTPREEVAAEVERLQERAAAERRRHGAGEAVVVEVDAAELAEEAERGGHLAPDDVVVEAEPPERGELADLVGDRAGEALEGELDGHDLAPRALDPRPAAGAGVEPRAVPAGQEPARIHQRLADGLQPLQVRLRDHHAVRSLPTRRHHRRRRQQQEQHEQAPTPTSPLLPSRSSTAMDAGAAAAPHTHG